MFWLLRGNCCGIFVDGTRLIDCQLRRDQTHILLLSESRLTRQTGDARPMLVYCWATVCDGGPTVNQHWVNVFDEEAVRGTHHTWGTVAYSRWAAVWDVGPSFNSRYANGSYVLVNTAFVSLNRLSLSNLAIFTLASSSDSGFRANYIDIYASQGCMYVFI